VTAHRLDTWLPDPAIRTHHRRAAAVAPEDLWAAARSVRLSDTRTLGRLVRWRIPGLPAGATFDGLLRAYPFTVLEEDEHLLLSGLCGRIWTLQRDYPRLAGPEDFRDWDERGTVRVLFANWLEPDGDGHTALVSEARVGPVDHAARVRLRALWAVVGRFERLAGAEALNAAMRRAGAR
jgi:hypothetical protein